MAVMIRRRRASLAIVIAALLVWACGGALPGEPITVIAEGVAFEPTRMTLAPGQARPLVFENRDAGVPHSLQLSTRTSGVRPRVLWSMPVFAGPGRQEAEFPALGPGPYLLSCEVHPNMQIELDVL